MLRLISVLFIFASFQVSASELCNKPNGSERLTENPNTRYIIFGELHGNNETPAVFAETVCSVAAAGKKVIVGIEHPKSNQDSFKAFMKSKGSIDDDMKFLSSNFNTPKDRAFGVTSMAMFNMLRKLRSLKQTGLDITVVPFVSYSGSVSDFSENQTIYEKELANNIIEATESHKADIMMILVGSVHAMKSQVRGLPFEPMSMHLPAESTLSIKFTHTGGDSWFCSKTCGPNEAKSLLNDGPAEFKIGIEQLSNPNEKKYAEGYDGIFNLGKITASQPATLSK